MEHPIDDDDVVYDRGCESDGKGCMLLTCIHTVMLVVYAAGTAE
jgi:hypothetical protein